VKDQRKNWATSSISDGLQPPVDPQARDAWRSNARKTVGRVLIGLSVFGVAAAAASPAPYVIEMPGPTFNALATLDGKDIIKIEGAETFEGKGNFDVLTVQSRGGPGALPSWLEVIGASLSSDFEVLPYDEVYPTGVTKEEQQAETTKMMLDSQRDAIAVALKNLGYKVDSFIAVDSIKKDGPSHSKLKVDDQVLAVNGAPVRVYEDITEAIAASNGDAVTVSVLRDKKEVDVEITPVLDKADNKYRIGIFVAYRYDFPIKVTIDLGNVTGPSGGLMFSLSIIDLLSEGALNGGKYVAGTGTIAADGSVGPIGGIRLKMIAAKNAGAEYFLAPAANCSEVVGNVPEGLKVRAVASIDEALEFMTDIREQNPISPKPNCPATK
jgi:PDZ domain-containing protein